ncbi:MAG: glycosyltransferase family 39 protein [Bacteroidetes bacterium]|nr:glycosyltransferase family 39 protein [Bacteroidota bacterium]
MSYYSSRPFLLFTISLAILLVAPILFRDGMFMDTVQYAAVSKNMAMGNGSFWNSQFDLYNIHNLPAFYEQPPLGIYLLSIFYKIFGNSMLVERIYTFLLFIIGGFLIVKLWKHIFKTRNNEISNLYWIPLLLWVTTPIIFHNYQNNFLENLLTVFCLTSILFLFKSIKQHFWLYTIISAFAVFLAVLTKGLPGLFPIITPLLYAATGHLNWRKALLQFALVIATVAVLFFTLLQYKPAAVFFDNYLFGRAFERIKTEVVQGNRFFIIKSLLFELLIPIVLVLISLIFKRVLKLKFKFIDIAFLFLLIGMSASFPIALTRIQKPFYLSPSIPFYAIGFGIIIIPIITFILNKFTPRIWIINSLSIVLLIAAIVSYVLMKDIPVRNKEMIYDLKIISGVVPDNTIISCSTLEYYNWSLHANLIRKYSINLDFNSSNKYYLRDKNSVISIDTNYQIINLKTKQFDIYLIK